MSDLLSRLGFQASSTRSIPSYAHWWIIGNFVFSYALLSTRGPKFALGLDHNVSPRDDLDKYGTAAVQKGKISQRTLDKLKRRQAAHANAVEHFPVFVGALLFATVAGIPGETINLLAALYTLARVLYAWSYITVTSASWSYGRSVLWWASNFVCFRLFYLAGTALNARVLI